MSILRIAEQQGAAAKKKYTKELQAVMRRFDKLDDKTVRSIIRDLQGLRRSVASALLEGTEFQQFRAQQITANVNQQIDEFTARLQSETRQNFRQAHQLGKASVVEPLQAAGIEGVFFTSSTQQLNVITDFSAELITNISGDMRGKINSQLRIASLGQKSPFETMKDITKTLGLEGKEIVGGVAARAETILRTETTRIFNLAAHSQQLATAEQVPGLRKRWMATGDDRTRPSHLNAHGQEVLVDEAFDVGGVDLQFPGDPAGPPEETINCRCTIITIHPDLEPGPLPVDDEVINARAELRAQRAKKKIPKKSLQPLPTVPALGRENFTAEYWDLREQLSVIKTADDEFYPGERQDLKDSLQAETELSALARRRGFVPGTMSPANWSSLADDLLMEAGDKLELATLAGREAAGRAAVGRKRIEGLAPTIQVGGQLIERKWVGGSAARARKVTQRINKETKQAASDFMTQKLFEAGYNRQVVQHLGFTQKRKLLAEIGSNAPLPGRIGGLTVKKRSQIISGVSDAQRLEYRSIAFNPRAGEGLEAFYEYEISMVKAGRGQEIIPLPDVNEAHIPDFVRRLGGLEKTQQPASFEIDF